MPDIGPLLLLLTRHKVASMLAEEPDLEEAFLDLEVGKPMSSLERRTCRGPVPGDAPGCRLWRSAALAGLVILTVAFSPIFKRPRPASPMRSTSCRPASWRRLGSRILARRRVSAAKLYEILVPILLVAAAVNFFGGQTAGEEAAGVSSSTSPSRSVGQ